MCRLFIIIEMKYICANLQVERVNLILTQLLYGSSLEDNFKLHKLDFEINLSTNKLEINLTLLNTNASIISIYKIFEDGSYVRTGIIYN